MKRIMLLAIFLTGCQSALDKDGYAYDPYENVNRKVNAFNDSLDKMALKPVAKVYDAVTPDPVQRSVRNFFSNLDDVTSLTNSLLQFEGKEAIEIFGRIFHNTIFGVFGIFDISSQIGLEKNENDFGKTLAHYGVESGPFIMLPFFGPSTMRDAGGRIVDATFFNPISEISETDVQQLSAFAVEKIQTRADLINKEDLLNESPDPYATMRDAWLQNRWGKLGQEIIFTSEFDENEEIN